MAHAPAPMVPNMRTWVMYRTGLNHQGYSAPKPRSDRERRSWSPWGKYPPPGSWGRYITGHLQVCIYTRAGEFFGWRIFGKGFLSKNSWPPHLGIGKFTWKSPVQTKIIWPYISELFILGGGEVQIVHFLGCNVLLSRTCLFGWSWYSYGYYTLGITVV